MPWSTTRFSPEGRHHTDVGGRSGECEHIHRELASGKGFADLVLIPRKNVDSPAIILELKYNRDAEGAIAQIHRKQYPAKVAQYTNNLLLVGINYDRQAKTHECRLEWMNGVE